MLISQFTLYNDGGVASNVWSSREYPFPSHRLYRKFTVLPALVLLGMSALTSQMWVFDCSRTSNNTSFETAIWGRVLRICHSHSDAYNKYIIETYDGIFYTRTTTIAKDCLCDNAQPSIIWRVRQRSKFQNGHQVIETLARRLVFWNLLCCYQIQITITL